MVIQNDSTVNLVLDETDMHLLRRYIIDLEYQSANYSLSQQKIELLESRNSILVENITNYKKQVELADVTINKQTDIQDKINEQYKKDVKNSYKKGIKKGAIAASVTTLVICLLIK